MINFREMVLEAITTPPNGKLEAYASASSPGDGFSSLITAIKGKFSSFDETTVKTSDFYNRSWNLIGKRPYYTSIVSNDVFYLTYPMVDFLFFIKENYGANGADNWGADDFSTPDAGGKKGLNSVESLFISHINSLTPPGADPLFNYTPKSSFLSGVHQKIKDGILGSNIIGKKTIKNCENKGYTIRQAIYLATQLRQRNMPIISTIPSRNKPIDDFLIQTVRPTEISAVKPSGAKSPAVRNVNLHLGGAVTPGRRNIFSAIFRPKAIPSVLKDMVDTLLSFMESVKNYADFSPTLRPRLTPPATEPTLEQLDESINKTLDVKVSAIATGSSEFEKEIYAKLMNMLNHVPGEKDWVGKLQATASALKGVESALGIKM